MRVGEGRATWSSGVSPSQADSSSKEEIREDRAQLQAIQVAHQNGHWIRSHEGHTARGLESFYALDVSVSPGPEGGGGVDGMGSTSGPRSRPARNSLLQILAFLGKHSAGAEAMGLYDT